MYYPYKKKDKANLGQILAKMHYQNETHPEQGYMDDNDVNTLPGLGKECHRLRGSWGMQTSVDVCSTCVEELNLFPQHTWHGERDLWITKHHSLFQVDTCGLTRPRAALALGMSLPLMYYLNVKL